MKIKTAILRASCAALAICMAALTAACSCSSKPSSTLVPADGYELPYSYDDGYKSKLKTVDDTNFLIEETDLIGNQVIRLTTKKSEQEVKDYYDRYFSGLQEVVSKREGSDTVGYFDPDKRLIMYNLIVWTADGVTNYKMGTEACSKIEDSKNWKAK